jgi:hypothetical protein
MSVLGHEQTTHDVRVMSDFPLKADIRQGGVHIRLLLQADIKVAGPSPMAPDLGRH